MPLLQRLSKRVGCRIWDAIKAKLKELTGREKIDKTLVDYVFVLFDPINSPELLRTKLVDFLGDKTDPFVEWFSKVVSQVDNQVSKAVQGDKETPANNETALKPEQALVETEEVEKAADACLDGILPQQQRRRERTTGEAEKPETHASDSKAAEPESGGSSRRKHRRERSDRSREERTHHKDNDERKGAASRMLSKAAQDAVKSVQSVGETRQHAPSSATTREKHRDVSPRTERYEYDLEITVEGDGRAESPQPQTAQGHAAETITPESPTPADNAAQEIEPEPQHITVVTRSAHNNNNNKRTFDEAMEVEGFHQSPVVITAAQAHSGATNRFVYQSAQGPLVVPEKESEENEPVDDDNNIPGLLVVMPATSHDPLSRIKLGNEDRMYGGRYGPQFDPNQRFHGHPRPPFAHLPPHQHEYWDEPMEEDFNAVHPAKRFRKAPPVNPIDPSLIMCRFLPKCAKRAEECPYFHPACRNGKFCRFGDSCVYDHSGGATSNANAKQLRTKKPICRFYPNCTQPQCQFLHKQAIACSFGTYCRRGPQKCLFLHPEDVLADTEADGNDLQIADYNDDDSELCDVDGGETAGELDQDGSNLSYEELPAHIQTA